MTEYEALARTTAGAPPADDRSLVIQLFRTPSAVVGNYQAGRFGIHPVLHFCLYFEEDE